MSVPTEASLTVREGSVVGTIWYPNSTDEQYKQVRKSGRYYDFRTLRYIAAVTKIRKAKVVYDVGTCFANHALYFSSILGSHVECFEPNVRLLPYIDKTMTGARASYNLHNVALGDQEGFGATSEVEENLGSSKFIAAAPASPASGTELTTLDTFIATKSLKDPDIVKIDTEGFECKILRGAKKMLERASPELFVEITPENKDEAMALLDEFGYRRVLFNAGKNYHYSKTMDVPARLSLTAQAIWIDAQTSLIRNRISLFGNKA